MRHGYFIAILTLGVQILMGPCVKAAVFYPGYYRDEKIAAFSKSGDISDFEKIDEEGHQEMLVADIIAGSFDSSPKVMAVKQQILNQYFYGADGDIQRGITDNAFQKAMQIENQAVAQSLFLQRVAKSPEMAKEYICQAIVEAGDGDKDFQELDVEEEPGPSKSRLNSALLRQRSERIKILIPLIAASNSSSITCDMGKDSRLEIPVVQLLAQSNPNFVTELTKQLQVATQASQSLFKEYSQCNETQLARLLFSGFSSLKTAKVKSVSYVEARQDKCLVKGLFRKLKNGYEYAPSNGIVGYLKDTIRFDDFKDFVTQLKKRPVNYLLPQANASAVSAPERYVGPSSSSSSQRPVEAVKTFESQVRYTMEQFTSVLKATVSKVAK